MLLHLLLCQKYLLISICNSVDYLFYHQQLLKGKFVGAGVWTHMYTEIRARSVLSVRDVDLKKETRVLLLFHPHQHSLIKKEGIEAICAWDSWIETVCEFTLT